MSDAKYSRRILLKGVAAAGGLAAVPGLGLFDPGATTTADAAEAALLAEGPVFAYVKDAAKGEVVLMAGPREIVRKDPALVARLMGAVGTA